MGGQNWVIDSAPETVDADDGQQTVPKERSRTRVWARARPSTPLPHPDFPIIIILLLWGTLWPPSDAPIVKIFLTRNYPCHPTLLMTLTLHPIMKTYFPLVISHSLTRTPPYAPLL